MLETENEDAAITAIKHAVNWLPRPVKDVSARMFRQGGVGEEVGRIIRPDETVVMPLRFFCSGEEVGRADRVDHFEALHMVPRRPRQYDERAYGIDNELRAWTRDRRLGTPREARIDADNSRLRLAFMDATLTADMHAARTRAPAVERRLANRSERRTMMGIDGEKHCLGRSIVFAERTS